MEYKNFRITIENYVATVVLDRPPVNAMNREVFSELTDVFDSLSDNKKVRVIVLTASGKLFSGGADFKSRDSMSSADGEQLRHNRAVRESFYSVIDCAKPVIAAVNGGAIGAGFALMMSADIVLLSDNAYMAMTEVDVGLSGGMKFLTQHFSRSYARYIYYSARRIPAAELHRLGIVQACVAPDKLMEVAAELARELAQKSPRSLQTAKRGFNAVEHMPYRDAYRFEQGLTIELSQLPDSKEARAAFLEKRKPVFKD